jgi:hypothetical protein
MTAPSLSEFVALPILERIDVDTVYTEEESGIFGITRFVVGHVYTLTLQDGTVLKFAALTPLGRL